MLFIFYSLFLVLTLTYFAAEFVPLLFLISKKRKTDQSYPPVTTVIPVKNEELVIGETISSWLEVEYPNKKEILICDQNSTDKTKQIIEEKLKNHPNIMYLRIEAENKLNTLLKGIQKATYEYVVISDADRRPQRQSLMKLMPYMIDEKIGAVFGMPHIIENESFFQKVSSLEYLNGMIDLYSYSNIDSVPYLFLHTCIIRKKLISNLPTQSLIADDLYFAINIRKQGYKCIFIPEVEVGKEKVIKLSDVIKRRLRTSQGTIEIAKSNYLDTGFRGGYGLFGLFIVPFRQFTIVMSNIVSLLFFPYLLFTLIFGYISADSFLRISLGLYIVILLSQILRFAISKKIFAESADTVPFFTVFFYPLFAISIRRWLAGFTFITALLGYKYKWKKSVGDRQ